VDRQKPLASRWWNSSFAVGVFAALIAAIMGPIATSVTTGFFESRNKSQLTFGSSETILVNGRVIKATIVNTGPTPAKDVVIAIESTPSSFEFNPEHVHAHPAIPFETTVKKGRLEVKLTSPLGQNQPVSITADELHVKDSHDPMFLIWVTSDRGLADRQGHEVRSHPDLTLDQFLSFYEPGKNGTSPSKGQGRPKAE
jgi:hypothetical protein